jgi:hypothetical protein
VVLVCGTRTWPDADAICRVLSNLLEFNDFPITGVITGGARGADAVAAYWAIQQEVELHVEHADWSRGPQAGPERNNRMLDMAPDMVVAFWQGQSPGTKHTVREAMRREIPTIVYWIPKPNRTTI